MLQVQGRWSLCESVSKLRESKILKIIKCQEIKCVYQIKRGNK